jgi:hypothetical protein
LKKNIFLELKYFDRNKKRHRNSNVLNTKRNIFKQKIKRKSENIYLILNFKSMYGIEILSLFCFYFKKIYKKRFQEGFTFKNHLVVRKVREKICKSIFLEFATKV